MSRPNVKKMVLVYSGGLDTSVIIPWLREHYGCEVIAFAASVGQGEDLDGLDEKAIRTGASKAYIEDLREVFVRDYVLPVTRNLFGLPLKVRSLIMGARQGRDD